MQYNNVSERAAGINADSESVIRSSLHSASPPFTSAFAISSTRSWQAGD
jgi:hypothetical protein